MENTLGKLDFLKKSECLEIKAVNSNKYKVLIADDDHDIHRVSDLMLSNFEFNNHGLEILHSYSTADTVRMLKEHKDIAVIILDIVMETNDAGLRIIKMIRKELNNSVVRIIVRTGQPGDAPEYDLVKDYDINDYRLKTELTSDRMATSMFSALRSYRDISQLKKHETALTQIIESSNRFADSGDVESLLRNFIFDLYQLKSDHLNMNNVTFQLDGVVFVNENGHYRNTVGVGCFQRDTEMKIEVVETFSKLYDFLESDYLKPLVVRLEDGFLLNGSNRQYDTAVFIKCNTFGYDIKLVELMASNFLSALDNFLQNNRTFEAQREILYSLGETADAHFSENGGHIGRVSKMMYSFAKVVGYSKSDCEMIKIASTMHDIGKIAIPDRILKKPGKLTEGEYEIMKGHTLEGQRILGTSNLPILKLASEIALYHHERMDGCGYPEKLKGEDIPQTARMMAIVDVFDALTNERVYKEAISERRAIEILEDGRGCHFDGTLLNLFLSNLSIITTNVN